jgi:hypothetical protein
VSCVLPDRSARIHGTAPATIRNDAGQADRCERPAATSEPIELEARNGTDPGRPAGQPGSVCAPVGIRTPNLLIRSSRAVLQEGPPVSSLRVEAAAPAPEQSRILATNPGFLLAAVLATGSVLGGRPAQCVGRRSTTIRQLEEELMRAQGRLAVVAVGGVRGLGQSMRRLVHRCSLKASGAPPRPVRMSEAKVKKSVGIRSGERLWPCLVRVYSGGTS